MADSSDRGSRMFSSRIPCRESTPKRGMLEHRRDCSKIDNIRPHKHLRQEFCRVWSTWGICNETIRRSQGLILKQFTFVSGRSGDGQIPSEVGFWEKSQCPSYLPAVWLWAPLWCGAKGDSRKSG